MDKVFNSEHHLLCYRTIISYHFCIKSGFWADQGIICKTAYLLLII